MKQTGMHVVSLLWKVCSRYGVSGKNILIHTIYAIVIITILLILIGDEYQLDIILVSAPVDMFPMGSQRA